MTGSPPLDLVCAWPAVDSSAAPHGNAGATERTTIPEKNTLGEYELDKNTKSPNQGLESFRPQDSMAKASNYIYIYSMYIYIYIYMYIYIYIYI